MRELLPVLMVLPFVALLLCIALLPILAGHFWHSNIRKGLVALGLSVPVIVFLLLDQAAASRGALGHALEEYVEFIVPLTALYVIAGGIVLKGDIRATPSNNTLLLACGAVLANLVGTTGASMLLIQPLLRINRGRTRIAHLPVFFIFVVGNTGGLLTPVGDPPLLLGFLHGVNFFWTLSLWPQWLLMNGLVLGVFYVWDRQAGEAPTQAWPEASPEPIRLAGLINLPLLLGILATILLQSENVAGPLADWLRQFVPCPSLYVAQPWGTVILLLLIVISWLGTSRPLRQANEFGWEAMIEVGVLFLGIFITMVPALHLLEEHGKELGLSKPWHFFWLTGSLSSFLDNAPTYFTFATVAAGSQRFKNLMVQQPHVLQAISCGAVFFGALSYVGNAPNFMVKAIAEHAGVKMPSFFGYMLRAGLVLLPICVAATWLFFVE